MRRMIGTNMASRVVASKAPTGYVAVPPGYGARPGYVSAGPDHDMKTTVYLLPNDDGAWFRKLVEKAGGVVREES